MDQKTSAALAVAPPLLQEKGVCVQVCAQVCAEPKVSMGCLGQSSFETGYAPSMRQPHPSLVIWIQLEHGQDPAGINLEQWYAPGVGASVAQGARDMRWVCAEIISGGVLARRHIPQ